MGRDLFWVLVFPFLYLGALVGLAVSIRAVVGWWRRRREWKRIEREAQALIDRGGT